MVNIVAYADELVLLAPSCNVLQELVTILELNMHAIDVQCNTYEICGKKSRVKTLFSFNPGKTPFSFGGKVERVKRLKPS